VLALALIGVLLLAQGVCLALAKGLRRRLDRRAQVLALLVPLALLGPWLGGDRLLFHGDFVRRVVDAGPKIAADQRHA
jgi:hypothetical protein